MSKRLLKTMVALLAIAAAAAGPVRGQNANPDVTLDFTTNTWGLPTSGNNYGPAEYTSGGYTITLYATTAYRFYSGYLLLGKDGSYLQLPAFSSPVEKIEVVGASGGSPSVMQNVYVGETAVSTQTTGLRNITRTYEINSNYRAAGNIYTLKVESAHNTHITYIKVYYAGGSTSEPEPEPEPEPVPVPITVRMAAGTEDAGDWTLASGGATVSGTEVLGNVMSGSQVTATYNGSRKVKSVKAVKYVAPAATVTTVPTAAAAIIEAGSTAALVGAGEANGGTMMYAVTTTNTKPTSTDGFSATVPTAEGRSAGTYYVWYYAKADADHSDSEIAGPVSVTLPVMYTVTWNSTNVFNSAHQNDEVSPDYTGPLTYEDISISTSGVEYSHFFAYSHSVQTGSLTCFGTDGDSFTFTAPSGKKFCKIEIIDDGWSISFDQYGDWTQPEDNKIVWSGTAANAVTLGTVFTSADNLTSIVFTLIDAQ